MLKRLTQRLKNKLLSRLFCSINPDNVFSVHKDGRVFLAGQQISTAEAKSLYEEIKYIRKCRVWEIKNETLKKDAMERAFEKAINFDDLMTAKLMLFNLDIEEKIFNSIESYILSNKL